MYNKSILPTELVEYILAFVPPKSKSTICIERVIDIYNNDHNWFKAKFYYVKNFMSFTRYYFYSPMILYLDQKNTIDLSNIKIPFIFRKYLS